MGEYEVLIFGHVHQMKYFIHMYHLEEDRSMSISDVWTWSYFWQMVRILMIYVGIGAWLICSVVTVLWLDLFAKSEKSTFRFFKEKEVYRVYDMFLLLFILPGWIVEALLLGVWNSFLYVAKVKIYIKR